MRRHRCGSGVDVIYDVGEALAGWTGVACMDWAWVDITDGDGVNVGVSVAVGTTVGTAPTGVETLDSVDDP